MGRILVVVFFAGWLGSALSLRLAGRHEKDDYQAAAAVAKAALANGQTVWWNALIHGADYYQVPLTGTGQARPGALALVNPLRETIAVAAMPDVVITSRPDVFDAPGTLAEFLAQSHYQLVANLTAFKIWVRPPANPVEPH